MTTRIAVLGAGAWGTALAILAARGGAEVALWGRDPDRVAAMAAARENTRHLPGAILPPGVQPIADAVEALDGAAFAVLAVPVQHLRGMVKGLPLPSILVAAKGVERGSLRLPLEILAETHPETPIAVLSGPNFAGEVAAGLPAAAVIASTNAAFRGTAMTALATSGFRIYGSDDPIGVQVGGAAKNVIAIAAGVVIGAGLGENARAALVTRGLAELARLVVALGGRTETAAGLSGMGDLLLTATGPGSRNTALGLALGRGEKLEQALAGKVSVAEGVATAPALVARAEAAGVELPICTAVTALLAGKVTVAAAMSGLLARPPRNEG